MAMFRLNPWPFIHIWGGPRFDTRHPVSYASTLISTLGPQVATTLTQRNCPIGQHTHLWGVHVCTRFVTATYVTST